MATVGARRLGSGSSFSSSASRASAARARPRGLADLEPDALELARQLLDFLVVELVLERERLELGRLDEAALLGALDDGADLIRLEQFVQLVLRQGSSQSFRSCLGAVTQAFSL